MTNGNDLSNTPSSYPASTFGSANEGYVPVTFFYTGGGGSLLYLPPLPDWWWLWKFGEVQ
jgi:hypothetical protein